MASRRVNEMRTVVENDMLKIYIYIGGGVSSYLYLYIIGDHFQSVLPYVRHNDEQ